MLVIMVRIKRRTLTPSEQRRLESTQVDPVQWGEWVAILVVLGAGIGGTLWLGIHLFTWAVNSPTAQLVMR